MNTLLIFIQVIVGLGILNVWLVRRNKSTPFRGGEAQSMKEEFSHYGLPEWTVGVVGVSKVILALLVLAGIWNPSLTVIGASGLALFMLGAVLMHVKVKDTVVKTIPSLLMLIMCALLIFGTNPESMNFANLM